MSLQRKTPLRRGGPIKRNQKALQRTELVKRRADRQRRRYDTGPSEDTKVLLHSRAKDRCELCGRDLNWFPFSRHHRRPRQMGGSSLPWINDITNLLLVCGTATTPNGCHLLIESDREIAYENGWLIPMGQYHPTEIPVVLRNVGPVYLTTDGSYAPGAP